MTMALNDAVLLRDMLKDMKDGIDVDAVAQASKEQFYMRRRSLSACMNLSANLVNKVSCTRLVLYCTCVACT